MKRILMALILTLALPPLFADDADTHGADFTKTQACDILEHHLAQIEGLPNNRPLPEWYCDFWDAYSDRYFYVVALWTGPMPGLGFDHPQSAGHFAVSKRSNLVLEFDLAQERLVPISNVYYAKPRPTN